jgi:putative zinc finger protein
MNCTDITKEIPNYCYGEISSEIEEAVEAHLSDCQTCGTELARHRKFLELLDERQAMADAGLLVQCRSELSASLRKQAAAEAEHGAGWRGWRSFQRAMEHLRDLSRVHIPFRVPVGAMALVALGFIGARYTPEKFGGVRAALAEPLFSSVRSVEPGPSGQVQIAVDEVRRHMVSGNSQDPQIQELLVNAVTDGSNPAVRLQSIQVLHSKGSNPDSVEVRQALLGALEHDPSAEVRLKALEGLKQFGGDAVVRKALANVLIADDNASVRVQAIDLLSAHHDDSIVGVLQNVVQKEDNPYVRAQITQLLEQLKASVGTY